MAGILTMSSDSLKYDPLKDNRVKSTDTYDPLGKSESKRVKTYDKELGYAVHPEEQAVDYAKRDYVAGEAAKQQTAIDQYTSGYNKAIKEADEAANGILSSARNELAAADKPEYDLVPIKVWSGDVYEGEYKVTRATAEALAKTDFNGSEGKYTSRWDEDNGALNVDTMISGLDKRYGKELHEALGLAAEETSAAVLSAQLGYEGEVAVAEGNISAAEQTFKDQRDLAQAAYESNLGMAKERKAQIEAKWTDYQKNMQKAYTQGMADNTSGIYALFNSGALQLKGTVK